MTDEFDIQCESCGTIYSNLEDVCPYCGQPQPLYEEPTPVSSAAPYGELSFDSILEDDAAYPAYSSGLPDYAGPADEFLEDEYTGYQDPYADYGEYGQGDNTYDEGYEGQSAYYDNYAGYETGEPALDYAEDGGYLADDQDEADLAAEAQPRRFTKRRTLLGCLGIFLCIGLFYGGIGLLGAYHGLQEQTSAKQAEAQTHFERGQEHVKNNSLELAIAEFELALSLNPGLLEAREALREARRITQARPTPTSETRTAAAASIMEKAEAQVTEKKWAETVETLAQIRDLDPDYQPERVSELIYTANYQLGLQLITPDEIDQALQAFERALAERPTDPEVTVELTKAAWYIEGKATEGTDQETAIAALSQLYDEDAAYLDVEKRLLDAYELYGDTLVEQEEWCQAETQFLAANRLEPDAALQAKAEISTEQCNQMQVADANGSTLQVTPQATAPAGAAGSASVAATSNVTSTTAAKPAAPAGGGSGLIYFSAFNPAEARWEILAVPASGGTPKLVVINGTMPAVSPDGRWLVYHSELLDAEGFHRFDLTSGEDARITQFQRHILPRWGSDSSRFIFPAQEPGTGRWQVLLGFADGKSDPIILRDGRTPDWSSTNLIAYQGTDPVGNNPGIYVVPFDGGEATRLTNHESDRSPDFSPDGSQLAYMSTQGGNWDIYTINTAGSAPRQITTSPGQDGLPAWSPDGSQIAYVSDGGGGWAIYVVSAAGGTPVKITPWDGNNLPDWLLAQIWWAR
ncbi:MAG: PD40 domain-containing protein [Anaerolineales bacterium]|nr:PD40 domain-containing protein [Anaerolineales bacterium]